MKSNVMPVPIAIGTEKLTEETKDQLTAKEKETLAPGTSTNTKFTAVDMWNRQRNIRSASDRLRRWNLN